MSLNRTLVSLQQHINLSYCPLALLFGVSGCFLNIILFSQRQFRNISCCTYFRAASMMMILVLLIGLAPHAFSAHDFNPANRKRIVCKLRAYASQSCTMMYRWLMTMACIDRYLASSRNILCRRWANPRLANRIILVIVLSWLILPGHNLYFLDIQDHLCLNSRISFAIYHSLFTLSLGGFLPPLIMIIFILLIHFNLQSKRKRRQLTDCQVNKDQLVRLLNARDHQVLVMLFVQVGFYIVSTVPWMIFLLYAALTRHLQKKSIDRQVIERFVRYLTEILVYLYPTFSFYMYTLTSRTFRRELIDVAMALFSDRKRSSQHHPKRFSWKNYFQPLKPMDRSSEFSERTLSSEEKNPITSSLIST